MDSAKVDADGHAAEIEAIKHDVLTAAAVTDPAVRALVLDGAAPEGLQPYFDKLRHASYRVTDEDIAALKKSGLSEDAIFELTVAASVGFAYERLQAGKRAMGSEP